MGWRLRPGLARIWGGERDSDAVIAGATPREQAALMAVLFHTRKLEQDHGPPAPFALPAEPEAAGGGSGGEPPAGRG